MLMQDLIFAILAGLIAGYIVNMGLVMLGPNIFPMPEGMIPEDPASIKEHMSELKLGNFFMVWLAHAAGSLASGYVVTRLAANHSMRLALALGILWLIGGIMMVNMVDGPIGFIIADLGLAYIPMTCLGWILAGKGE